MQLKVKQRFQYVNKNKQVLHTHAHAHTYADKLPFHASKNIINNTNYNTI